MAIRTKLLIDKMTFDFMYTDGIMVLCARAHTHTHTHTALKEKASTFLDSLLC